jgi:Zn-finger nucleic acid-binding protein
MEALLINVAVWGTLAGAGVAQAYFLRLRRKQRMRRFFPEVAALELDARFTQRRPTAEWYLFDREVTVVFTSALAKDPVQFEIRIPMPRIPHEVFALIGPEVDAAETPEMERRLTESKAVDKALSELLLEKWALSGLKAEEGSLIIQGQTELNLPDLAFAPASRGERVATLATALEWAILKDEDAMPCPHCRVVPMHTQVGALLESMCPRCQGRFLPPQAAQRLLQDELGLSPGDLKDAATGKSDQDLNCPRCASDMTPALVEEVIANLCRGCGSLWLDENELNLLSQGRYEKRSEKAAS